MATKPFPLPIALKGITPREAVADAMYRACLALDNHDEQLWVSAWTKDEDITFEMDGKATVGMEALNGLFNHIGPMVTQHTTSAIRIDLAEGAKTANLTAYAVNTHYRAGEGMDPSSKAFVGGARYSIDVVRDEGPEEFWRLKTWKMQLMWCNGDSSVMG